MPPARIRKRMSGVRSISSSSGVGSVAGTSFWDDIRRVSGACRQETLHLACRCEVGRQFRRYVVGKAPHPSQLTVDFASIDRFVVRNAVA